MSLPPITERRVMTYDDFCTIWEEILENLQRYEWEHTVFGVRLAFEEAMVNALKHGNRGDTSKSVLVRYRCTESYVWMSIRDEGDGFDPHAVPNPCTEESREKPSGRGVLLMKRYTTRVKYNSAGNSVMLYFEKEQRSLSSRSPQLRVT